MFCTHGSPCTNLVGETINAFVFPVLTNPLINSGWAFWFHIFSMTKLRQVQGRFAMQVTSSNEQSCSDPCLKVQSVIISVQKLSISSLFDLFITSRQMWSNPAFGVDHFQDKLGFSWFEQEWFFGWPRSPLQVETPGVWHHGGPFKLLWIFR